MNCSTPQAPTPCVPCVHPFEYLFELAYVSTKGANNRTTLAEGLDRLLDKGINFPNCGYCCPDCEGVYALASVETMLKLYEAVGLTASAAVPALPPVGDILSEIFGKSTGLTCCSNVYASVETSLKYYEGVGITQSAAVPALPYGANTVVESADYLASCCNGFDECVDDLICLITENVPNAVDIIDRLNDRGIIEYGQIQNNCTGAVSSSICKFVDLLKKYQNINYNSTTLAELVDRFLDKGIVISCDSNGEMHITSVETWLKYAEAVGLTQSPAVPALGNTTTTTTTTVLP